MLGMAVAAVITGSQRLEYFDSRVRYGVPLSIAWVVMIACFLAIYEIRRRGIASTLRKGATTEAPTGKPGEEEEVANAEEIPIVEPKVPSKSKVGSPWTSTLWLVYVAPCALGIAGLVVLTAVAFSGSPNLDSEMVEASASQTAVDSASDGAGSSADSNATTTLRPTLPPYDPSASFYTPPKDCGALPLSYVGDGWCDDFEVMLLVSLGRSILPENFDSHAYVFCCCFSCNLVYLFSHSTRKRAAGMVAIAAIQTRGCTTVAIHRQPTLARYHLRGGHRLQFLATRDTP
jgi:hypothetical protein